MGWYEFVDEANALGVMDGGKYDDLDNGVGDFDNDSDIDIYVVRWWGYNIHYQYDSEGTGVFDDVASTAGTEYEYDPEDMKCYVIDINDDGLLDIYLPIKGYPSALFVNDGNGYKYLHKYLDIDFKGTLSNRNGIGSFVHVSYDAGGGQEHRYSWRFESDGSIIPMHFGLETATSVDAIEVAWPSGITQFEYDVPTNQRILLVEPEPSPSLSTLNYIDGEDNVVACPAGCEIYTNDLAFSLAIMDAQGRPIQGYPPDNVEFVVSGTNVFLCDGPTLHPDAPSDENGMMFISYDEIGGSDPEVLLHCSINGETLDDHLVFWLTSYDLDGDGDVDLGDFSIFAPAYPSSEGDPNYSEFCDYDSDGDIDLTDFSMFTTHWQHGCPAQ
jgi:hypothetical protein